MPTTQLIYDIVPDKSPLYTTVDQLNQSTCALRVTATNAGKAAVMINAIEIELMKVKDGEDTVQLLLPGSESGIQFPNSVIGPGQTTWTVTNPTEGQFQLTVEGGATFQAGDTLSFTLQNIVIREGGTGSAFVHVIEASSAGRGETEVGIGITQSTLSVQLSSDRHLIEPNGVATLAWTTTDAASGSLTLPGNSPSSITLDPHTNLTSGQQQVSPIVDTTYSLSCQGLGPNVTSEVTVSVDSLQMGELEASAEIVHVGERVLLKWHTNADSCTLDDGSGNPAVSVPTTVPTAEYPQGFPVFPRTPTTYTVKGKKKLGEGDSVDFPSISNSVDVYPVQITDFSSSVNACEGEHPVTLSWQTVDAVSCALSTTEGGSVNVPVANGQIASCNVFTDGEVMFVWADGSELGRLPVAPELWGTTVKFVLSAAGVNPKQQSLEILFYISM
ncbi:MAG TPA: hypothetical protein VFZ40_18755 [Pyrinomonadaceae bacterium]